LHNGDKVENPTVYFDRLIDAKQITQPMGKGQKWVFDIQDFPATAQEKLR
jgi:hypothetical protein